MSNQFRATCTAQQSHHTPRSVYVSGDPSLCLQNEYKCLQSEDSEQIPDKAHTCVRRPVVPDDDPSPAYAQKFGASATRGPHPKMDRRLILG